MSSGRLYEHDWDDIWQVVPDERKPFAALVKRVLDEHPAWWRERMQPWRRLSQEIFNAEETIPNIMTGKTKSPMIGTLIRLGEKTAIPYEAWERSIRLWSSVPGPGGEFYEHLQRALLALEGAPETVARPLRRALQEIAAALLAENTHGLFPTDTAGPSPSSEEEDPPPSGKRQGGKG